MEFELQTCTVSLCLEASTCTSTFKYISASPLSTIISMAYSLPLCTVYRSRTTVPIDQVNECAQISIFFPTHWKQHQMILCYFSIFLCGRHIACLLAFGDEKWLRCVVNSNLLEFLFGEITNYWVDTRMKRENRFQKRKEIKTFSISGVKILFQMAYKG